MRKDGQTDGRTDRRMDRETDGKTDERTDMTKVTFAFLYLFECTYKPAKLLAEESQFVSRQLLVLEMELGC